MGFSRYILFPLWPDLMRIMRRKARIGIVVRR